MKWGMEGENVQKHKTFSLLQSEVVTGRGGYGREKRGEEGKKVTREEESFEVRFELGVSSDV